MVEVRSSEWALLRCHERGRRSRPVMSVQNGHVMGMTDINQVGDSGVCSGLRELSESCVFYSSALQLRRVRKGILGSLEISVKLVLTVI
jgi:hypothetical protein